jgi:phosphoenolpyruvate---glycerone phosphotransferase subunit DhaL
MPRLERRFSFSSEAGTDMNGSIVDGFLREAARIMAENRDYLIKLDSVVGDGDLGLTMSDGFAAAYSAIRGAVDSDVGMKLYRAGKAMATAVPSTMGTLMASGLMQAGKELRGKTELSDADVVAIFRGYLDGVVSRGKAKVGDKTFIDGFQPGLEALSGALAAGDSLAEAASKAAIAAGKGFADTTTMIAVHGRAATRGEASRTLEDPGAAVAFLLFKAFSSSLA